MGFLRVCLAEAFQPAQDRHARRFKPATQQSATFAGAGTAPNAGRVAKRVRVLTSPAAAERRRYRQTGRGCHRPSAA